MKRTMKIGGGRSITFEDGDGNKVYESLDAWKTEGERRFGADVRKWKFKCPMCGHVAAVEDFINLKVKDPANSAYEECIGPVKVQQIKLALIAAGAKDTEKAAGGQNA